MVTKRGMRTEKDFLGKVNVPKDAYYGAFTARAEKNFQLSGLYAERSFIKALGMIKKAAALTNHSLGNLETKKKVAIVKAATEVSQGLYDEEFVIDVFQAGAGTPYNMNCNEVIANRATELLGGRKGKYLVHPNNDVNMSQSSNDVIPTAIRIAVLYDTPKLLKELQELIKTLRKKSSQFKTVVKTGRTHLQDAVPITLGQEFRAYADSLAHTGKTLKNALHELCTIHLGGTAIGTGINTHPRYRGKVVSTLRKLTQLPLQAAENTIALTQSMDAFVSYSTALKLVAVDLTNISTNLRVLSSGPKTGIGEIKLPEVEPGSSIMPGKVNPSILEATTMVSYQVIGNDHAVTQAAMHSMLELNTMTPLILYNLLESLHLLTNTVSMLRKKCVQGITADHLRAKQLLEQSATYATALNPYLGYDVVAYLIKEAHKKNRSIKEIILKHQLLSKKELATLLSFKGLTQPTKINKAILKKVQANKNYKQLWRKVKK